MVDPASHGLRVIYSTQGGTEVERSGTARGLLCPPHADAVAETLAGLITNEPEAWRGQVAAVGKALARMLIEREPAMAEINPLFVSEAGCLAGDAKVVVDLGAADRQPVIAAGALTLPALDRRKASYQRP